MRTLPLPSESSVKSSLMIVPIPSLSEMLAPDAPERTTLKVSDGSTVVSPLIVMEMVWLADPAGIISVPESPT